MLLSFNISSALLSILKVIISKNKKKIWIKFFLLQYVRVSVVTLTENELPEKSILVSFVMVLSKQFKFYGLGKSILSVYSLLCLFK